MSQIFVECKEVSALVYVPCCYYRCICIDPSLGNKMNLVGFPVSRLCQELKITKKIICGLMVATESIQLWVKQDSKQKHQTITSHFYRCLSQLIFLQNDLRNKNINDLRFRASRKYKNFVEYFNQISKCNDLECTDFLLNGLKISDIEKQFESHIPSIRAFLVLRVCLSQVLETLILLDRVVYLYENSLNNDAPLTCTMNSFRLKMLDLLPIFDDSLSPRNMAVIAVKQT